MALHTGDLSGHMTAGVAEYVASVHRALEALDIDAIGRLSGRLHRARLRGATIFIAGNGGSAATAAHWVNDLGKATRNWGGPRMRVVSLCDNTAWLTALANDEGYESVFAEQLDNLARPGDVLAIISASGSSPNVVRAVELAAARDVETIGLLGFDGGVLRDRLDDHLLVSTELGAYELVEDVHAIACHLCTRALLHDAAAWHE